MAQPVHFGKTRTLTRTPRKLRNPYTWWRNPYTCPNRPECRNFPENGPKSRQSGTCTQK